MNKKKETKNKKGAFRQLAINLAAMVAVVIVAVFITFRWIDGYTEHGVAIKVIDVTGMQEEEAIHTLSKHDLEGITSDHVFVKGVPTGEIISQRPAGNAKVKRGRKAEKLGSKAAATSAERQ